MKTTSETSNVRINKSMVMQAAWAVLKHKEAKTFSEALKMAWRAFKLRAKMALGVVKFSYRKLNGEVRQAVGTLKNNMYQYDFKGSKYKRCPYTICYFDIEKKAFRSFNVGSLI